MGLGERLEARGPKEDPALSRTSRLSLGHPARSGVSRRPMGGVCRLIA